MHRHNEIAISDPNQMHGVLRAQSELGAGFHESLIRAALGSRISTSLPEKPQRCPEQPKNKRDSQRLSNNVHVLGIIPPD
jgi:hypothetical protein